MGFGVGQIGLKNPPILLSALFGGQAGNQAGNNENQEWLTRILNDDKFDALLALLTRTSEMQQAVRNGFSFNTSPYTAVVDDKNSKYLVIGVRVPPGNYLGCKTTNFLSWAYKIEGSLDKWSLRGRKSTREPRGCENDPELERLTKSAFPDLYKK